MSPRVHQAIVYLRRSRRGDLVFKRQMARDEFNILRQKLTPEELKELYTALDNEP